MELKQLIFVGALLLLSLTTTINADTYDNDIQDGVGRQPKYGIDFLGDDYVDELPEIVRDNENKIPIEEPTVNAGIAPCLGCAIEIDPKNEKVNTLAQFAFSEYMTKDSEQGQQKTLVRVTKAQTQVVAGVKYILDLEIGWTNCTKEVEIQDEDLCQYDKTKPTFTCVFHIVEKSWLNSKELVHSDCHRDGEAASDPTATGYNESYDYDSLDDEVIPPPPVEDSAVTQEGTSTRRKRDTNSLGNIKDAKEGKGVVEDIAKFALSELDRIDEDNNARILVEVLSAKKQTVSGWLYHLKLQVAPSTCAENSQATLETCKDKIVLPFVICDVKVLLQPWQTVQKKLTQGECQPMKLKQSKKIAKKLFSEIKTKKRNLLGSDNEVLIGGRKVIDPNSGELTELVDYAIDSVDASSNALHAQKLVRVVYADRQLVSGILTNMVIEVGYTTCRKNPTLDKSKCDIDESRSHQYCNVTIHEKPWLKERTVQSARCGKPEELMDSSRVKRDVSTYSSIEFEPEYNQFGSFVEKFNKVYETEEEYGRRYAIFKDNMRKVKLLQENEQGTGTYGATVFADLTEEEFTKRHLGLRVDLKQRMKRKQAKVQVLVTLPDEFDWRHYNIVTPVKNQGMCGSCWAFSVTGNIEGLYALKHAQLESFSEQELVDCDTMDEGCNGGLPENAYKALEKLGGLETESEYPYEGKNDKCHFKQKLAEAKVTGFVELPKNETEMAAWLVKNGPISIGINANAMQFYFGGVSHPWKFLCSPKNLDHGVLIVGYGVHTTSIRHKTMPYWLIKNSWGNWGEKGYYRVYRGDNTCGVAEMATSAVIA